MSNSTTYMSKIENAFEIRTIHTTEPRVIQMLKTHLIEGFEGTDAVIKQSTNGNLYTLVIKSESHRGSNEDWVYDYLIPASANLDIIEMFDKR